jgi:hypothetical protein
VQIGAALVVRDRLVETVESLRTSLSSREQAEKELNLRRKRLEAEFKRYERRGTTARTAVEREVKSARSRFENEVKVVEKSVVALRDDLTTQADTARKDVTAQTELVTARVENLFQTGISAGTRIATKVQERLASVA